MSVPPLPQSVYELADEMDTGPRSPDWAVFLVAAWPHLYAAALRHAADRLDYPNPLDGDAVQWLRDWAAEAEEKP